MGKLKKEGFCPNYAVPPGETLEETLRALDMTQADLAQRTGRPKKTINEIIKGKAAITPETALQFERALGVPATFWNNLERNYRETLARLKEEKALRSQEEYLKELPISSLEKAGWIPKKNSAVEKLQAFLNFFGVAGIKEWNARWMRPQAAFHRSAAFRSNPAMVAAWLRLGEIKASKVSCKSYSANSFRASLDHLRKLSLEPPNIFEPKMKEICARSGVAILFVPELRGTHVYGATRWLNSNKALIQLSFRGKSDDYLWFAFFHEAAHILLHGKKEVFIEQEADARDGGDAINEKEKAANLFAQEFLIPPKEYQTFLQKEDFSLAAISGFAKKLGIAPGIVVGRLQHERNIPFSHGNSLKKWFQFSEN
jgi:HTH-type transcriptional regulator/antitoxin HigA